MLPLTDARWGELSHAYGSASDIPGLLRGLEALPPAEDRDAEPYFGLWSSLCHQGDVSTASYAAVPHLCALIRKAPERVPWTILLLVASIEIARMGGRGPAMPPDLKEAYQQAMRELPSLVAATAVLTWDDSFCRAAVGALAAATGHADFADVLLDLDADEVAHIRERRLET